MVTTTLMIPCYNEEESIAHLCERLRAALPLIGKSDDIEVLFVDDGSGDRTADRIKREAGDLPYRIVTHKSNQGLGAALRTGFAESRGREIVTLDSDCTYDPVCIPELLAALRDGNDIVTGSPYHPRGQVVNVVRWRLVISKTLSYIYWCVLPVRLYTYTSCFRAYRKTVVKDLEARNDGFLAVTQLLVSGILRGFKIAEVPASLSTRNFGKSKMRIGVEIFGHIRYILWIIAARTLRRI
jgi:dolichol-phosphate mannosyltransferase